MLNNPWKSIRVSSSVIRMKSRRFYQQQLEICSRNGKDSNGSTGFIVQYFNLGVVR